MIYGKSPKDLEVPVYEWQGKDEKVKEEDIVQKEAEEVQQEVELVGEAQVGVECVSNKYVFTAWVTIPQGFYTPNYGTYPEFAYNTEFLTVFTEVITVNSIILPSDCQEQQILVDWNLLVKKIKLIGCIKYFINLDHFPGNPGGGYAGIGNEGSIFINQVVKYAKPDYVVPKNIGISYSVGSPGMGTQTPNGDVQIPVQVTLTFYV